jgi:hypothetical protein
MVFCNVFRRIRLHLHCLPRILTDKGDVIPRYMPLFQMLRTAATLSRHFASPTSSFSPNSVTHVRYGLASNDTPTSKRPSRTISLVQDGLFTCYSASLPAEAASLMADNASSKESPLPPLPCTTPAISALYAHQRTRTLPCSPDCCTFTPIRNVPFCG